MLKLATFTDKKEEQELIYEILADKGNKEIADTLGLSLNTVKVYLKNLMRKLNVTSRSGIVSFLLLTPSRKKKKGLVRHPGS